MNDAQHRAQRAWDETNACTCPEENPCRKCYCAFLAAIDEIRSMPPMVMVKELTGANTAGSLVEAAKRDHRKIGRRICQDCKSDSYDPAIHDACYSCRNKDA